MTRIWSNMFPKLKAVTLKKLIVFVLESKTSYNSKRLYQQIFLIIFILEYLGTQNVTPIETIIKKLIKSSTVQSMKQLTFISKFFYQHFCLEIQISWYIMGSIRNMLKWNNFEMALKLLSYFSIKQIVNQITKTIVLSNRRTKFLFVG